MFGDKTLESVISNIIQPFQYNIEKICVIIKQDQIAERLLSDRVQMTVACEVISVELYKSSSY